LADGAVSIAIALAAGFFLIERTYLTEFQVRRSDAQRLIFLSTVAALALMVSARVFLALLQGIAPSFYSGLRTGWLAVMPAQTPPWVGTAGLALGLSVLVPRAVNRRWPRHQANRRAIRDYGSNFERLVIAAFDRQRPIAITLKSRKVYVGRIVRIPILLDIPQTTDIRILPLLSGYRDESTFGYRFTTSYSVVYERILDAKRQASAWQGDPLFASLDLDDFEIVIPTGEMTTAHLFDIDLYRRHAALFDTDLPPAPPPPPEGDPVAGPAAGD
jgi:hypothetical protein